MGVEQIIYDTAVAFVKKRFPVGWGGAAVVHTSDNRFLMSVAPDTPNHTAELCIETGAICEANKYDVAVTHILCVVRDNENSPFRVVTPCGICQERLRQWGGDVLVGVAGEKGLTFVTLRELMPFQHWDKPSPRKKSANKSNPKINVREAEEGDFDKLSANDDHVSARVLIDQIKERHILTAYADGAFAGWLRYSIFHEDIPFMNSLHIIEEYRGMKAGTSLVNELEHTMKKRGYNNIMVSAVKNSDAQHFFRKLGYKELGGYTPIGQKDYEIIFGKKL